MQVAEMPTLFGVSISTQLKELDLMSMTPLDAMNKLYELQQQSKQRFLQLRYKVREVQSLFHQDIIQRLPQSQ